MREERKVEGTKMREEKGKREEERIERDGVEGGVQREK